MYKVRVLLDDLRNTEKVEMCTSYNDAVDRFLFYVHLALEFNCYVRCVNIIHSKKSIRLFQNH